MEEFQKYKCLENVIQSVNSQYISLSDNQIKINNRVIDVLCTKLIEEMKETDELFRRLFKRIYYGGSYYDGLKITNPEEYDCDLLLELPKLTSPLITTSERHPGFVHVLVKGMHNFEQQEFKLAKEFKSRLLDDKNNYLRADKLKRWIESTLDKVSIRFPAEQKFYRFLVDDKSYYFRKTKGGPALTLHITECVDAPKSVIDIDLVPCFNFKHDHWPRDGNFRDNPSKINTFFVVPKTPKGPTNLNTLWRLSFQQQELELLSGKQSLKSALKLLKRFRDQRKHYNISSYFIKTVFLWQIHEGGRDQSLWEQSLSVVFMIMLKKYCECLKQRRIDYFWNRDFNLLGDIKEAELEKIENTVTKIISKIDRNLTDNPFLIASYLIPKEDEDQLRQNVSLGKKFKRSSSGCDCSNQFGTVEESLREISKKLDIICLEQKVVKSLLEKFSDQQMDIDDTLCEINKVVTKIYAR